MDHQNELWVRDRLNAATPTWNADFARGHALLNARSAAAKPQWFRRTAPVMATLALAVAGAAVSHEVWQRLTVSSVDVVRLDLSKLPLDTQVTMHGPVSPVRDLDEAARNIGFVPHFPASYDPVKMSVVSPAMITQTVHVEALRKLLPADVVVPDDWDGKVLRASLGATLIAEFADGVNLLQTRPIEMLLPHGFPLERFVETVFRAGGMTWREARTFAQKFAMHPSWLLDIPQDEEATVREVHLNSGHPAVLVEDRNEGKQERFSILFGTADRVYLISAPDEASALRAANGL